MKRKTLISLIESELKQKIFETLPNGFKVYLN